MILYKYVINNVSEISDTNIESVFERGFMRKLVDIRIFIKYSFTISENIKGVPDGIKLFFFKNSNMIQKVSIGPSNTVSVNFFQNARSIFPVHDPYLI